MSAKTITRPQALALRNADELPEELLRPVDALRGLRVVDARPNTCAALVRLGLAEEIEGQHVLTRAGENVRAITELDYLPRLDLIAAMVAAEAEEAALAAEQEKHRPEDGTYYPAEEGAKTWRAACPMYRDGRRVSAVVENGGQDLYVYVGGEIIYDGDMPAFVKTSGDVIPFVRQYAEGWALAREYRTLWSYRDHAGRVWGPYADAEFAHTDGSAERYCRGIVDTTGAGEVIRIDRRPEHFETTGRNWTDTRTVVHVAGAPAEAAWNAAFEKGRALGKDYAAAHDYADEVIRNARIRAEAAPAPVSVYVTTADAERIEYAHVPNGDPSRVAHFLDAARAVPTYRDASTDQVSRCERVECEERPRFIGTAYGRPERLCSFHSYATQGRRPIA
ncbi:hypothetical protein EV284_3495 [Streptomyces sp. BK022]|uniref:hypothetical protein n=1 Tax=Streptomyces sp. BK022 TaxID=2512123 RepID=UPI00102A8315|nr:hypothetical protein [Streptomyces sp. BK022]RZU36012.1 hypothetical protein EV284_3495 [Streptomyces sp. BK022]